jgi:hypothetical protein
MRRIGLLFSARACFGLGPVAIKLLFFNGLSAASASRGGFRELKNLEPVWVHSVHLLEMPISEVFHHFQRALLV